MGSGAARELGGKKGPERELTPGLSEKVGKALGIMDSSSDAFRERREEEKFTQIVKQWNGTCKRMDAIIRSLNLSMMEDHQLSLDAGSTGGGQSTSPFVEETSYTFKNLEFKLKEGEVHAVCDGTLLAKGTMENAVDYDWVEKVMVKWIVFSVKSLTEK